MTPDATMLSRRYAELLRANGCCNRTIDNYLYALKGFTRFLGERPLSETTADDIIAYQVDAAARGLSDSSVRAATYALRGFFQKVLERSDWNYAHLPRPRRPQRLPEVLSVEEVLHHRSRAQPQVARRLHARLRPAQRRGRAPRAPPRRLPAHADSRRARQGNKDRQLVLSERLLLEPRRCWKTYRPQRYLIEGKLAGQPIAATSIQRAFRAACKTAGITKHVTPRSLRPAFATPSSRPAPGSRPSRPCSVTRASTPPPFTPTWPRPGSRR